MTEEEQAFGTWLATAAADLSKFSQLSDTQKEDIARKMESALSSRNNALEATAITSFSSIGYGMNVSHHKKPNMKRLNSLPRRTADLQLYFTLLFGKVKA